MAGEKLSLDSIVIAFLSGYTKDIESVLEKSIQQLSENFALSEPQDGDTEKQIEILIEQEKQLYENLKKPGHIDEKSLNRLAHELIKADKINQLLNLGMEVWHLLEKQNIDAMYAKIDADKDCAIMWLLLRDLKSHLNMLDDQELRSHISKFLSQVQKEYSETKELSINKQIPLFIDKVKDELGSTHANTLINYIANVGLMVSKDSLNNWQHPRYTLLSILQRHKSGQQVDYMDIDLNFYKYLPKDMQENIYQTLKLNVSNLSLGLNGTQIKYVAICGLLGISVSGVTRENRN